MHRVRGRVHCGRGEVLVGDHGSNGAIVAALQSPVVHLVQTNEHLVHNIGIVLEQAIALGIGQQSVSLADDAVQQLTH